MANFSGEACIVLEGLPKSAFCGIDLLSFTTSQRFRGIRNLPGGWHFVFTGIDSAFSIRHGAWFHVGSTQELAPEVHVKKWDDSVEEFVAETDERAILETRANLGHIWRESLTPYRQSAGDANQNQNEPLEKKQDWQRLTDGITEALLSRVTGQEAFVNHWSLTSASAATRDMDHIPGLTGEESNRYADRDLNFLPIDLRQTWREGAIGRERTEAAQDKSWALTSLIENHCQEPFELIGELQFCFLMVLTLNNNSCLSQWKRILQLVLTSKSAVLEQSQLFVRVLSTLKLQLEHCEDAEGGLFDMSDAEGNLLKALLRKFRQGLEQLSGKAKVDVMDELDEVEDYLRTQYGWLMNESYVRRGYVQLEDGEQVELDMKGADEEDESGEFAPTIVDLTPEQAAYLAPQAVNSSELDTNFSSINPGADTESDEADDWDVEDMDARY